MTDPRPSILVREGLLNARANPTRSIATLLLALICGFAAIATTGAEVSGILAARNSQVDRGIEQLWVSTPTGTMSAEECDGLMRIRGVASSGGIVRESQVIPRTSPASPLRASAVTPGYLRAMFPELLPTANVVIGGPAGDALGLKGGSDLAYFPRGSSELQVVRVDDIAPTPARADGIGWQLFVTVAPLGEVRECLVAAEPGYRDSVTDLVHAAVTTPVTVQPMVFDSEVERNPQRELADRVSQYSWIVVSALLTAFALMLGGARRKEYALYRILGYSRTQLVTIAAAESSVLLIVPALYGAGVGALLFPVLRAEPLLRAVLADYARLGLAAVVIPLLAAMVSVAGSSVDRLKGG